MKKNLIICILVIGILTACNGQQKESERLLKNKIDSVYNFKPHLLKDPEKEEKSVNLDKFWQLVKSDTLLYLKELRNELNANGHSPFFYFDGGALLIELSASTADKQIAANAIPKCDIKDLSQRLYVSYLNKLATEKVDITLAALKILEDTSFSFFIPQHSMYFNQGYCLMYSLLPLEPDTYIDILITTFKNAKEIRTQQSIITTIWFSNSCRGDTFLKSLNEANTLATNVSDYSKMLISNTDIPKEMNDFYKVKKQEDLIAIKQTALTRFSDEAIDELDFVSKTWREKYGCR